MKIFYSHAEKIDGKKVGSKRLNVHTEGVASKARLLYSSVNLPFDNIEELIAEITKFHDLGKYTPHFQNYLLDLGRYDSQFKQHAKFGAFALYAKYEKKEELIKAIIAFFIIVHHHKSLTDFSLLKRMVEDNGDDSYIFEEQWKSIRNAGADYLQTIKNEVLESNLESLVMFPEGKIFRRKLSDFLSKFSRVDIYFLINYIFSLLIEADKLDASNTEVYTRKHIDIDSVDVFLSNRTNNPLRTQVRKDVIERLDKIDLINQRIFTLTAPTGVGKTFIALDVALKLRNKVPALKNAQIIYALPFINIIEQGFDEYKKALGERAEILAHYQYADVFGEDKKVNNFSENEPNYNQKLMELDTWQSDIIITSFVQFFHTLIGYKNKLLKKFSHFANAIIILDEVQTLKLSQLPLLGAIIYYLSKYLNTYVILMTATKPKLLELAYREILEKEGEPLIDFESLELLQKHTDIYASYKRTKIVQMINEELKEAENIEETFVDDYFKSNWSSEKSCLIVVNKVNRCIDLFDTIKKHLEKKQFENPIYCLSTNIIPADRFNFIKQIKLDLQANKGPILIATQVVEAGVDLNFDMGFRDLGPIDSIIQVAGRINREADPQNPKNAHLPLFIIDFGDCEKIYGKLTSVQAMKALKSKKEYLESEYLTIVESYFSGISDKSSFDESKKIFDAIKNLRYDGDSKESYVSDFAIIEDNKNTVSVFVLADERAYEVKEAYEKLIMKDKDMPKEKFDKNYKRDFHQRIIAVPKYYTNHLEIFNRNLGIDYMKIAEPEHYNQETGFIRNTQNTNKAGETHML